MVEPLLVGAFVVGAFAGGGAFVVGAFAGSIVFFFLKKASSVSESSESESELTCRYENTSIENKNIVPSFFAVIQLFQFHNPIFEFLKIKAFKSKTYE